MAEKMKTKKLRLEEEKWVFKARCSEKLCYVKNKGSILCVICKQNVRVPKEHNLRRHFETAFIFQPNLFCRIQKTRSTFSSSETESRGNN